MPLLRRARRAPRRRRPAAAPPASLALAALAAACTPSATYAPPAWTQALERDARFDSATVLDATRVVFSWSEGRFRYVAEEPLWGRGQREYVSDEHVIGIYDVATGAGRIVHAERKTRIGDGNGAFAVVAARGRTALVFRDRYTERGVLVTPGGWLLLDLESGALRPADIATEVGGFEHELASMPSLAAGDGTLLLRTHPRGMRAREVAHKRYFLRRPDGELLDLGVGSLRGEADEVVFLARPNRGGADAYDARTGALRTLTNAEVAERGPALLAPRVPAVVYVRRDGSALRYLTGTVPDVEEVVLQIDVEALR